MSDVFVKLLNSYGYQPVFLPRTEIVPPELYNFADHKLIRRGALASYFRGPVVFRPTKGKLGNIEGKITSGKSGGTAIGFLKNALAALGLGALPKIDLSFTGSNDFVFSFTNVTFESVDPAVLDPKIQDLAIPLAIPDEYIVAGALHIAYEYAYANTLSMSRQDGKSFSSDVSGSIGQYIDLGVNGKVNVTSNKTVSFSATDDKPAAFAYKAGRLEKRDARWIFEPEIVMRGKEPGAPESKQPFIPAYGVVLLAEMKAAGVGR